MLIPFPPPPPLFPPLLLRGGIPGCLIALFPPPSPAWLQPSHSRWWPATGPSRWHRAAEAAVAGLAMAEGKAGASGPSAPARRSLSFHCLERWIAVEGGGVSHDDGLGQAQPPGAGMTPPHTLSPFPEEPIGRQ